jgi:hypothetical protein
MNEGNDRSPLRRITESAMAVESCFKVTTPPGQSALAFVYFAVRAHASTSP